MGANSGPNTNSGHFSLVVAPAPHLNGGYTIFGELVEGVDTMWAINGLYNDPPRANKPPGDAVVKLAGCLENCAPRPEVTPKCKTKATTQSSRQGRMIFACLD